MLLRVVLPIVASLLLVSVAQGDANDNKRVCDICRNNTWVFVVATGRSGSTTILEMLNAIPSLYLAGENKGMAKCLHELYEDAKRTGFGPRGTPTDIGAWYHADVKKKEILCELQRYARTAIGAIGIHAAIGWKEIRYDLRQLDFMKELFPCAKFVVNFRKDTESQHRSQFHRQTTVEALTKRNEDLVNWSNENRESAFQIPLEEFSIQNFNRLVRWLNVSECTFSKVAHANRNGYTTDNVECVGKRDKRRHKHKHKHKQN